MKNPKLEGKKIKPWNKKGRNGTEKEIVKVALLSTGSFCIESTSTGSTKVLVPLCHTGKKLVFTQFWLFFFSALITFEIIHLCKLHCNS
jgi:hypothetical protein